MVLSEQQKLAAKLQAAGLRQNEITLRVGCGRTSLWNYQQLPAYQEYLRACCNSLERDYSSSTARLLDAVIEQRLAEVMLKRRLRSLNRK